MDAIGGYWLERGHRECELGTGDWDRPESLQMESIEAHSQIDDGHSID
jgi:hypothetical protein